MKIRERIAKWFYRRATSLDPLLEPSLRVCNKELNVSYERAILICNQIKLDTDDLLHYKYYPKAKERHIQKMAMAIGDTMLNKGLIRVYEDAESITLKVRVVGPPMEEEL